MNQIKKILREALLKKSLEDDIFIHFTTLETAKKIMDTKLLGKENLSTFAVSAKWGYYNSGDVLPKNERRQIAIMFKTKKLPKYGYVEEVVWAGVVPLTHVKLISVEKAVNILLKSELNSNVNPDDEIEYI
jgi:hypothetical protein